jgi:hypothetical protein
MNNNQVTLRRTRANFSFLKAASDILKLVLRCFYDFFAAATAGFIRPFRRAHGPNLLSVRRGVRRFFAIV